MAKKINFTSRKALICYASLCTIAFMGLVIPFSLSLFTKDAESDGFYGEVSLRSYFERGTGRPKGTNGPTDPGDPYVITRPRHLYNLSRLQNLGVFNEPTAFQLGMTGLAGDLSNKPLCYVDDTRSEVVPFLDMKDSDLDYEPITAIGTEAVPFFGEFDGQGLEIKNLNVYADPEDAGLFGYTAHGSKVHDLFLDNVTIHSLGYTSAFAGLYGPSSTVASGTYLTYKKGAQGQSENIYKTDTELIKSQDFDASAIFTWDGTGTEPTVDSSLAPIVGFSSSNSNYRYKFLISGDFLTDIGNNQVMIDLPAVYKFFKKEKANTNNFPLTASSSVSLVASTTDNYGLDHSKVVMSLEFNFSLNSGSTNYLIMQTHLGEEHTNNIGLIAGHCDGTIIDCYVHKGTYEMNDGGASYTAMTNSSGYGLIGLVGATVHDFIAEENGASTSQGKDIGVLDFTTIYDDIITPTSFNGSVALTQGRTYIPSDSRKYRDFLRKNGSDQYVTEDYYTVSFNRQRIINNTDLGIFTIATDRTGDGMGMDAGNNLSESVVRHEDLAVNSSYYVYYATGEYNKETKASLPFSVYRSDLLDDTPSQFFPGYHFPNYDQVSTKSFDQRDAHQNYMVRFKVDGAYRTGKGFYFSDVDKNSPGGSFMSHYFEHKLVDKEGKTIPASSNSSLSGVMLRNSLGQEIRSFSSSFATPDLSTSGRKMYCINNLDFDRPAANMINFEIKTNTANVTVVAGLTDRTKPAALGVYKIAGKNKQEQPYTNIALDEQDNPYVNIAYDDPDYAFFMPTDDHLAYFDYKVENDVGKIGVYTGQSENSFVEATTNTEATVPSMNGATGRDFGTTQTKLFAHTFKLEPGKYCLGSATGFHRSGELEGTAKIFYVCAQGQTDGHIQFIDNTFASADEVKNVDFVKTERYTYNEDTHVTSTNIDMGTIESYMATGEEKMIENLRCYVSLLNNDRSLFAAAQSDVVFVYEDNKFKITTSHLSSVLHFVVSSYAKTHPVTGLPVTPVSLFGATAVTDSKITYDPPSPQKETTQQFIYDSPPLVSRKER